MERSEVTIEEQEVEEYQQADWDDPIACQLEELLTNNLFATFCSAVKKIVECGYTEEAAEWAVLNSSLFHGSKDGVSNVVDGALAFLKREKEFNSPKHPVFEGLQSLVDYTLLEMIHVLREEAPGESPTLSQSKSETSGTSQLDSNKLDNPKQIMPRAQSSQPETPVAGPAHQLPNYKPSPGELASSGKESSLALQEAKGKSSGVDREHMQTSSQGMVVDEKSGVVERGHPLIPREICFDRRHFTLRKITKVACRRGLLRPKLLPGEVCNSQSGLPASVLSVKDPVFALPAVNSKAPASSVPDTDPRPKVEIIPHKQALEKELQGWTDWANEKVMQAARRLGKDQGELKMLRQEKEELEKFKKEKQTLEESTMKRLSEMEYALSNATGQIEVANCTVRRLEEENSVLKEEMEAAKLQALGSATNLQEAMLREQEALKKLQSWDAEKGLVLEQLTNLKRQIAEFDNRLEKAKGRQNQFC
ncbi:hypothetical protein Pfo_030833 [Paulownia fortunei]|nr:hypothetical protein Pfo_030833 [Paulownia fortunei]